MSEYTCTFISVTQKGRYIISTRVFKDFYDLINEVWVLKADHIWVRGEYRTEKYKSVFFSSPLEGEDLYEIELSVDGSSFNESQIPFFLLKTLFYS